MDDINNAFQSILDDYIKNDQGKLTSTEMKAVEIHHVPVTESNKKSYQLRKLRLTYSVNGSLVKTPYIIY